MFYDAQIAGLPDSSTGGPYGQAPVRTRAPRPASGGDRVAVRNLADLKLINGGGGGSLHTVSSDHQLTELATGSGLYGPTLFDHYRGFTPTLAAYFVSPVVRKPSPRRAVVYSGGYIASGPPGWSREPLPWVPRQLRLCERFDRLHLVQDDQIIDDVPTYRGEGRNFG
jgi:hypothetical protein